MGHHYHHHLYRELIGLRDEGRTLLHDAYKLLFAQTGSFLKARTNAALVHITACNSS